MLSVRNPDIKEKYFRNHADDLYFGSLTWYAMLVITLIVLQMVTQEQLATLVHASEDYAS